MASLKKGLHDWLTELFPNATVQKTIHICIIYIIGYVLYLSLCFLIFFLYNLNIWLYSIGFICLCGPIYIGFLNLMHYRKEKSLPEVRNNLHVEIDVPYDLLKRKNAAEAALVAQFEDEISIMEAIINQQ